MEENLKKHSFFEEQTAPLNLNEENNFIEIIDPEAEHPIPKRRRMHIFEETADGNMRINYCSPDRELYRSYTDQKNPRPIHFHQIRHQDTKGPKYTSPAGMPAFPFLPPLIETFEKKEKIESLYLTEGAKKAFKACQCGIPTVGLTSVHTYKDRETGRLHKDIERIVIDCQVENLVFLVDADFREISEKALAAGEDIAKRPLGFYSAAKNIRELAQQINLPENRNIKIYFLAIDSPSLGAPKGFDDLLYAAEKKGQLEEVKTEISGLSLRNRSHTLKRDITSSTAALLDDFQLKNAAQFYHYHSEEIGEKSFCFFGNIYQWIEEETRVGLVTPEWTAGVFFIGNDWYELISEPRASEGLNGKVQIDYVKSLKVMKKSTLTLKYGKKYEKFIPQENFYDSFCSLPSHFDYQQRIGNAYNLYFELPYTPFPGDYSTTLRFIKHIFGEEEVERNGVTYKMYELGLDYLQILLTRPMHPLPVLILYSPENETGKSTFAQWLFELFGSNAIPIGNNDLRSDFNQQFAGKILAICEETLLDKRDDLERIKAWSTATEILINPKGQQQFKVSFYCKFQLYSNEKRMIYLTENDQRFWMLQVPLPKEKDPDLKKKMRTEIPAFLYFLQNREISAPREGRMWFHWDLYRTQLFQQTVAANEPMDARHLREGIREMFYVLEGLSSQGVLYQDRSADEILMPLNHINKVYFNGSMKQGKLKDILQDHLKVEMWEDGKKVKRGEYLRLQEHNDDEQQWVQFVGRPYVFKREDFV